jgi:hypothetical protein
LAIKLSLLCDPARKIYLHPFEIACNCKTVPEKINPEDDSAF